MKVVLYFWSWTEYYAPEGTSCGQQLQCIKSLKKMWKYGKVELCLVKSSTDKLSLSYIKIYDHIVFSYVFIFYEEMSRLTVAMCWELVTIKKDKLNSIGAAIYQKPDSNDCYEGRKRNKPPMCKTDDDPNASWWVPMVSYNKQKEIQGDAIIELAYK